MKSALGAEKSGGGDDNEAENVNPLAKFFRGEVGWGGGGSQDKVFLKSC